MKSIGLSNNKKRMKKKSINWGALNIMLVTLFVLSFVSCNKDDSDSNVFNRLIGTWTHVKWTYYNLDGELVADQEDTIGETYLTFTKDPYEEKDNSYVYYSDYIGVSGIKSWVLSYELNGRYLKCVDVMGDICKINESELQIKNSWPNNDGYTISHYRRASEPTHNFSNNSGGNNGGGGGGSSNDVPYVTGFDFTASKTSIKVTFRASSRPASASIYYGERSATKSAGTPTIIGTSVTTTVNGLKSGTKYYFKCTVKNSKGSSTSDDWPAMTQY